jgi:hypothetical protein
MVPKFHESMFESLTILCVAICAFGLAMPATAQCEAWMTGDGVPGVTGTVYESTLWDPDGSGPEVARVVFGGSFTNAGGLTVNNIVAWNPATGEWTTFGSGTNEGVYALITLPNGDLLAGGTFTTAGGVPASRIARWNGTNWSAMGSGVDGGVNVFSILANGDVVAAGLFGNPADPAVQNIARWNGTTWVSLGSDLNGPVFALARLTSGELIAGGSFNAGIYGANIATWNGSVWTRIGSGITGTVYSIAVMPNGKFVAGGTISSAGGVGVRNVAFWDGTKWSDLGGGMGRTVYSLVRMPNGDLLAGGAFTSAGTVSSSHIARWNGSAWTPMGLGVNGTVRTMTTIANGELSVAGVFSMAGGQASNSSARYSFTGIPTMSVQPAPQSIASGQSITLSATPSSGYSNVSAQWYRDGLPIADGPGGASPEGGTVSGASQTLPSPTDGSPATLTITNAIPYDSGNYTVVFSNSCGQITSQPALVDINSPCPADLSGNGEIDFYDFLAFYNCFDTTAPCADIDDNPGTDFLDFLTFFNSFDAGC